MRIKLTNGYAGPAGSWPAGTEIDRPEVEAKELIGGGYAVAVPEARLPLDEPVPETAALPPAPETATAGPSRAGRRKPAKRGG